MRPIVEVFERKPEGFAPAIEAAACYIEVDRKLLLLQRSLIKSEPGTWGVPAGKLEAGETPIAAAKRELFEETGIAIEISQMRYLQPLYVCKPELDYVYHLFKIRLTKMPPVVLSDENQAYQWASSTDMKKIPLMTGAKESLQYYWSA